MDRSYGRRWRDGARAGLSRIPSGPLEILLVDGCGEEGQAHVGALGTQAVALLLVDCVLRDCL